MLHFEKEKKDNYLLCDELRYYSLLHLFSGAQKYLYVILHDF